MATATRAKPSARKSAVRATKSIEGGDSKKLSAKQPSAVDKRGPAVAARAAAPGANPVRSLPRASTARVAESDFAFTTVLADRGPSGLWPHLFLSHEASRWLGKRGMVNLIVNVNGAMFRRTARPDGAGGHFVLFNAEMRELSGVEPGDRVRIGLEVDHALGIVDTPRELEQALLSDPAARAAYSAMPASQRRVHVQFIEEAKRPEARVRRIQQALRMMAQWGEERAAGKKR